MERSFFDRRYWKIQQITIKTRIMRCQHLINKVVRTFNYMWKCENHIKYTMTGLTCLNDNNVHIYIVFRSLYGQNEKK
jgi:hypothetical protein